MLFSFKHCYLSKRWLAYGRLPGNLVASFPILTLIFLLGAGAVAQEPGSDPTGRFIVTGTVVNSVTGEPIRRALVQIMQRSTFTDDQGHFEFAGVTPMSGGAVQARKPGYFSEQEIGKPFRGITLSANMEPLTLKLVPQSVIRGRITSTTGEPLEEVPVRLMGLALRNGHKRWETRGYANSDENGGYRFPNLMPGTYSLSAGPVVQRSAGEVMAGRESSTRPRVGYPDVYYPGVPDMNAAAPLKVTPGQQITADFNLAPGPIYNVSGTITGMKVGEGVNVQAFSQSGDALPFSTRHPRDMSGRFEAYLPAGVYVLGADSQSPGGERSEARLTVNVTGNLGDLVLAMQPSIAIPVEVRREARTSSPSSSTFGGLAKGRGATTEAPVVTVHLIPVAPPSNNELFATMGVVPRKGFAVRNAEPGHYAVELTPVGNWYVYSAQYGQQNLLTDDLSLVAGAPVADIEIVMRDDVATLTGTVKKPDGSETPATVLLVSATSKKVLHTQSCAPNTEFNMGQLAPGEYLAVAMDNADSIEYSNPEVLQAYLSQATRVSLAPNQQTRIDLKLVSTGE